ncbi:hypothetical protein [Wolbachia endosymbiont (group A) of Ennomos erosarius]
MTVVRLACYPSSLLLLSSQCLGTGMTKESSVKHWNDTFLPSSCCHKH